MYPPSMHSRNDAFTLDANANANANGQAAMSCMNNSYVPQQHDARSAIHAYRLGRSNGYGFAGYGSCRPSLGDDGPGATELVVHKGSEVRREPSLDNDPSAASCLETLLQISLPLDEFQPTCHALLAVAHRTSLCPSAARYHPFRVVVTSTPTQASLSMVDMVTSTPASTMVGGERAEEHNATECRA